MFKLKFQDVCRFMRVTNEPYKKKAPLSRQGKKKHQQHTYKKIRFGYCRDGVMLTVLVYRSCTPWGHE